LTGTVSLDRAAITNAHLNLEFCEIRSPMDAQTGGLRAYQGNIVKAPDDSLVTLNQIHPIYAQFGVPEQFLPEIKRQMRIKNLDVAAAFQGLEGPAPQGELVFIDNTVDTSTGMIQLRARFPNDDDALWPGQYVQLQVTLSEKTNVVVVPSQAVQTGQNGEYTYVVKADQTVEERPVVTGITYEGMTVVTKGVQAGETVVTDGQLRLAPGVAVSEAGKMTFEANRNN
jgi:multidrug efflux system membrane fusion protein